MIFFIISITHGTARKKIIDFSDCESKVWNKVRNIVCENLIIIFDDDDDSIVSTVRPPRNAYLFLSAITLRFPSNITSVFTYYFQMQLKKLINLFNYTLIRDGPRIVRVSIAIDYLNFCDAQIQLLAKLHVLWHVTRQLSFFLLFCLLNKPLCFLSIFFF